MGQANDVGGKVMLFVIGEDVQKITWICVEFHSVGRDGNQKKRRYAIPSVMNFSRSGVERWHSHFVRGFWTQKLSFGWNGWRLLTNTSFFSKRTGWLKWLSGFLGSFLETLSAKKPFCWAIQHGLFHVKQADQGQKSQHQTPYLDAIYQSQKGNSEVKMVQVFHV